MCDAEAGWLVEGVPEGLENGLKMDALVGLIGDIGVGMNGTASPGGEEGAGCIGVGANAAPLIVGIGIGIGPVDSDSPSSRSINYWASINNW